MNENVAAMRYAKGLAEVAADAGQVREVRDNLEFLGDLLDPRSGDISLPEFLEFLRSPTVTEQAKLELTNAVLEKVGIGKIVSNFLGVLVTHNRVALLPRIVRDYDTVADQLTGEATASVESARPLTDKQRADLADALAKAAGQPVHLLARVEPALVGGVRIHMRDSMIDATILGRLQRLASRLG